MNAKQIIINKAVDDLKSGETVATGGTFRTTTWSRGRPIQNVCAVGGLNYAAGRVMCNMGKEFSANEAANILGFFERTLYSQIIFSAIYIIESLFGNPSYAPNTGSSFDFGTYYKDLSLAGKALFIFTVSIMAPTLLAISLVISSIISPMNLINYVRYMILSNQFKGTTEQERYIMILACIKMYGKFTWSKMKKMPKTLKAFDKMFEVRKELHPADILKKIAGEEEVAVLDSAVEYRN